jgi:hypothetical protein
MIDVNSAVSLKLSKQLENFLNWFIGFLFLSSIAAVGYISLKGTSGGEDWLLSIVAIIPAVVLISAGWFYIVQAKKSFNSDELLEETSRILSSELPQAIARRIIYYTERKKDEYYKPILDKDTTITDIKRLENSSLNDINSLKKAIGDSFIILSNVSTGVPSCMYKIEGNIENDYPLIKHLTIGIQINVYQVEATYNFTKIKHDQKYMEDLLESTIRGAGEEGVGYIVKKYGEKNKDGKTYNFQFKARLKFSSETNLLLDSCDKLFFIQDIAVMTGYLIQSLKKEKEG